MCDRFETIPVGRKNSVWPRVGARIPINANRLLTGHRQCSVTILSQCECYPT